MREPGSIVPIPTPRQALEQVRRVHAETGKYPSGICRFCGCVDERACPGGCAWIDDEHTVCSSLACYPRWVAERTSRAMGGTA